jgi:hypothetical protein
VTHPFHPLCGRELDLVTYRQNWGEDRVYFHDDQGQLRALTVGWTSLGADDPFVVVSANRAAFRTADLLKLVTLVDHLQEGRSDA